MRHPNVKEHLKAPFVIAAGEQGIDRPGSLECDERTLDALDMPLRPAITSSMVMIPGEPVHLSLTHPDDFLDDLDTALDDAGRHTVVKLGPVYDEEHLATLLHALAGVDARVILDGDVFGSLSENRIDAETAGFIKKNVFPITTLFTPDIDEAEQLLNRPIVWHGQMMRAAEEILVFYPPDGYWRARLVYPRHVACRAWGPQRSDPRVRRVCRVCARGGK